VESQGLAALKFFLKIPHIFCLLADPLLNKEIFVAKKAKLGTPAPQIKQRSNGYKIRSTNDLLLLSMILDEDSVLKERIMRFMEAQLGKTYGGKPKDP
jgi:hypothetical protein